MTDHRLPAKHWDDRAVFDPALPSPLVQRGIELLESLADRSSIKAAGHSKLPLAHRAADLNNPAGAMIALSSQLAISIRRSLGRAKAGHAAQIYLTSTQNDLVYGLVLLASTASSRTGGEARRALRDLVRLMAASGRFIWIDELGPRLALELSRGRLGPASRELYANLNHHRSAFREHVIHLAWLARGCLDPSLAAERILFNVGACHGFAARGLAVLWSMTADDDHFLTCINDAQPDFANGEAYGWGLDTPWPERREAVLREELAQLRDSANELSRYVREPLDLQDFERDVVEKVLSVVLVTASQSRLPF